MCPLILLHYWTYGCGLTDYHTAEPYFTIRLAQIWTHWLCTVFAATGC